MAFQGLSTQFVNAALQLSVTPHVTADGSVLMDVQMTNNAPSGGIDAFVSLRFQRNQRKRVCWSRMEIQPLSASTCAEKKAMREVPFLAKIPVLDGSLRT